MNPKDFAKKRKAHIEALAQIKTDWEDWLEYTAQRFIKKFGHNGIVLWGNYYYKPITDEKTGKLTMGSRPYHSCSSDEGIYYPFYDEDSDTRWKYKTLAEYQDSVARFVKLFYDDVISVPLCVGFISGSIQECGEYHFLHITNPQYKAEIRQEQIEKTGDDLYWLHYESLKDY